MPDIKVDPGPGYRLLEVGGDQTRRVRDPEPGHEHMGARGVCREYSVRL